MNRSMLRGGYSPGRCGAPAMSAEMSGFAGTGASVAPRYSGSSTPCIHCGCTHFKEKA
jgi:hypothetical protein